LPSEYRPSGRRTGVVLTGVTAELLSEPLSLALEGRHNFRGESQGAPCLCRLALNEPRVTVTLGHDPGMLITVNSLSGEPAFPALGFVSGSLTLAIRLFLRHSTQS
jgi:hypothetical protein